MDIRCCASAALLSQSCVLQEMTLDQIESVPSVSEAAATGEIAEIYSDIRNTLGTSVVNLIWRNMATMPGALRWTW
jgi:hypothetical protein